MQTSTRPSKKVEPPTSLISPSVQSVCLWQSILSYIYIFISKHELTEYGQTPGTNILIMTTVGGAQWISLTVNQVILCSKTNTIVKPDWFARTITKVGLSWCASTCNEKGIWVTSILHMPVSFLSLTCIAQSQLSADYCTVWSGKEVLTNSAPDIVVADLHSTFIHIITINKPHISFSAISWRKQSTTS